VRTTFSARARALRVRHCRVVSDLTIRSAAEQDIEQVLLLWEAAGSAPSVTDSEAGLRALLAFDPCALLVADAGGVLVGSLIAAWDGWRASFYRLAVDPGRRREGIATALLHEGERRLQARGAIRLTAIVTGHDVAASGFWQAAGYTRQPDQARFVRHAESPLGRLTPPAPSAGRRPSPRLPRVVPGR
jgi:ribosomal protein S18 acetylase RimI-like enzyme